MAEDKSITKIPSPMDYQGLRDYGLDYIRKIGSRFWTDFNVHDPGVTILEALTLAINDLSYRSSASMADLLTRKGGRTVSLEGTMFPTEKILANSPTTPDDYRKMILENIPGIRNIWFIPAISTESTEDGRVVSVPSIPRRLDPGIIHMGGGYHVMVELEDLKYRIEKSLLPAIGGWVENKEEGHLVDLEADDYKEPFRHCISTLFLQHRNLCEEILDIEFMDQVQIGLSAQLEIESGIDMRAILQEIYERMHVYVSPTISYHTVEDLVTKGRKAQDIFSIPAPSLGFIDREELITFNRRSKLYISDVIAILMAIEGVRSVHHVRFIVEDTPAGRRVKGADKGEFLDISSSPDLTFAFVPNFLRNLPPNKNLFYSRIVFSLNGLTFLPPPPRGENGIQVRTKKDERTPLERFNKRMPVPTGSYRGTDRYFSFQNLLPATYRMGVDTLPESAPVLRKAERMQLKAYLTFFDQLLSDYLAQIDRFQDLLSVKTDRNIDTNATYFHGKLTDDDIVDVSKVLFGYPEYKVQNVDRNEIDLIRKNEVLDHLLSRFAESFAEYASLEYIRNNDAEGNALQETVEDKKRFLADYSRISSLRSCGVDWTNEWQVTGAERRIMRRLGIDDPDARGRLSDRNELGLYVVEHLLLAPRNANDRFLELARTDEDDKLLPDPYSFRVTAVLPGWLDMTGNLNYRKYAERIIREEIPAHIHVKTCWISRAVMAAFEDAYASWLSVMKEGVGPQIDTGWEARRSAANNALVSSISLFSNVYRDVTLMDDDVPDYDDGENITRLDNSYLGDESAKSSEE